MMPQVTGLVDKYVPKIKCETALDVGIGDGETIKTMLPFFEKPELFGCDPIEIPKGVHICIEKKPYHESKYYEQEFDLITFFDSLACYQKDEGERHLEHAMSKARKLILVWTPNCYYPYEPFRSGWHAEDFLKRGFCVYQAVGIHQGPPMVADGLLAWKLTE